jgi:nicotinamidase-related amidase
VVEQGADEVVLLGAQTDHCVAATVTGAIKAGLKVTVVSDGHSTWDFGARPLKRSLPATMPHSPATA